MFSALLGSNGNRCNVWHFENAIIIHERIALSDNGIPKLIDLLLGTGNEHRLNRW
jgi:hypothetical protein